MARLALLRPNVVERSSRSRVEVSFDSLHILGPETKVVPLRDAVVHVADARQSGRFVRHIHISLHNGRFDIITPPDEGAIAPRCAGLPGVPGSAVVISADEFVLLANWLLSGGRLARRTVGELAALSTIATSSFAEKIGEYAGELAVQFGNGRQGPMRGDLSVRHLLRPLEELAKRSERAAEAYIAALARSALSV